MLLASAEPGSSRLEVSEHLAERVDWPTLYELVLRERAAGPLWRCLKPHRELLPREFCRSLERASAVEELRQIQLGRRISEAVRVLREAGIAPVLLKGAALLQTHYSDVRDRPMADIDVLVPPGDGERARDALLVSDWSWDEERFPDEMYARHYHLPPLEDERRSGIGLEVHTGLLVPGHPFAFGPEALRRQAREVEVDGERALVPDAIDHLVYLCIHFAWSHALGSAAWRTFRDLGVLVGSGEVSWDEFLHEVAKAGAGPSAYWTLRLGRELAGRPVPERVLETLRPSLPQVLLDRLARHYALELFPDRAPCPSVRLKQILWVVGNEWGQGQRLAAGGKGATRPWEFSDDFQGLVDEESAPEPGTAKLWRHLRNRGPWRDYLRRLVL